MSPGEAIVFGLRWCLLALFYAGGAVAAEGQPTLAQLNHRVFSATDGGPSDIVALAQTTDGTLWVGSRSGLARFDGVRFVSYPAPSDAPLHSTNVSSLLATSDGGLWIGFRLGGASLLKAGHITRYGESEGFPAGTVAQFAVDRSGTLWAATRVGLARFAGNRWEKVTNESELGAVYGVLEDAHGTLWVAALRGLFAKPNGADRFLAIDGTIRFGEGTVPLGASADGTIWAAAIGAVLRIDPTGTPGPASAVRVHGLSTRAVLLLDRDGYLWTSAADKPGSLRRIPLSDLLRDGSHEIRADQEELVRPDGDAVGIFAMLEDREGNVWVGTDAGLHRFSHTNVVRDTVPNCPRYLDAGLAKAVFVAGEGGTLWVTCEDGVRGRLDEVRDGKVVSRQVTPVFNAAFRDQEGTVWLSGATTLGRLENGRVVKVAQMPRETGGRPVESVVRDGSGAVWVSVVRRTLWRFHKGEWAEYGNLDALPREYPLVSSADDAGAVWFGYTHNRIARVHGRGVQLFDSSHGLQVGHVLAILAEGKSIWVGGELGLARLSGEKIMTVTGAAGSAFKTISGIVRARNGDLWLNSLAGIVHIGHQEIERVVGDPAYPVESETFDSLDGLPGLATDFIPQPSAIETTDGRIWFSTTGGVVSIDATQLVRNTLPPPVTIWSLVSEGKRYPNVGTDVTLPMHSNEVQVEYTAGSLTVPERVRFRYRLEGLDRDWKDVGALREARFTNLGPGRYTFRVTAANNDRVWNPTGSSISFVILPAFYQTRLFYGLCCLTVAAMLAILYRVRVRAVAAQVRGRLEARLAERERIARDLHDTLLQGVQGLILRFQAVADGIPADDPTRHMLEQSLDRADEVLGESRLRVKGLRPLTSGVPDLARAVATEGERFAQIHPVSFRASVDGVPRELHPIAREECFFIAREALANAFVHARARAIEAEITYEDRGLHVRVRDDGQGVDPELLAAGGRPGHFGLIGMRERAKRLGAHIEIWSKPQAGTEVALRVPAGVAYKPSNPPPRRILGWLARLWSSGRP